MHLLKLHSLNFLGAPKWVHPRPDPLGNGLLQYRTAICRPYEHVWLQGDQSDHSEYPPSTSKSIFRFKVYYFLKDIWLYKRKEDKNWVRLNYNTTHNHPPPAKIYPPPPTTIHYHPPPAITSDHQPKYIYHHTPPPSKS